MSTVTRLDTIPTHESHLVQSQRPNLYPPAPTFLRTLFYLAVSTLCLLSFETLTTLGWSIESDAAPLLLKLHPALYILGAITLWAIVVPSRRSRRLLNLTDILLITSSLMACAVALLSGGGLLSYAIVTFLGLAFMRVAHVYAEPANLARFRWVLESFFVLNSIVALMEFITGHHLAGSVFDLRTEAFRSTALLGHPLNNAYLTGAVVIIIGTRLAFSSGHQWANLVKALLHGAAMITFGSRSAIGLLPIFIMLPLLLSRSSKGKGRVSSLRRFVPLTILLIGLVILWVPNPLTRDLLARFSNDYGSVNTRSAAIEVIQNLSGRELLIGVPLQDLQIYLTKAGIPVGLESAWLSLTVHLGLLVALPLSAAILILFGRAAASKEQGAFWSVMFFMTACSTSMTFGTKSIILMQFYVILVGLAKSRDINLRSERGAYRTSARFGAV